MQGQELELILIGPLQLRIFHDSVIFMSYILHQTEILHLSLIRRWKVDLCYVFIWVLLVHPILFSHLCLSPSRKQHLSMWMQISLYGQQHN